jgi:hypothetical protein
MLNIQSNKRNEAFQRIIKHYFTSKNQNTENFIDKLN